MDPYATADQYKARYGDVDDTIALEAVLEDATRLIASELERAGKPADDEQAADVRMQVCRQVASRVMDHIEGNDVPLGVTQIAQSAGPFAHTYSIGNPYGDMYLTKAERRMLGLGRGRMGFLYPGGLK